LQKLEYLSLAYNEQFQILKNLPYLKRLRGLRTLNLTGIPQALQYREIITKELHQVKEFIFTEQDKNAGN
jgi:hypothetical protein